MTRRLFIDGAAGTTGLEIRDRLGSRDDFELITLDEAQRKDAGARRDALNAADFVILCLPDDAAREAVSLIDDPRTRVIDASTAHRVADGWTYGFAELEPGQQASIAQALRVANPGCYPTGFLALIRPLVRAGLVPHDWPLTVNAISGYSGGGKAMIAEFEGEGGGAAYRGYALDLAHKHVPEIQAHIGLSRRPFFVPAYGAFRQGIVLTVPLDLGLLGTDAETLHACLDRHYAGSRHVQVLPLDRANAMAGLDPEALNGTNDMRLGVFHNAVHGQALLAAVFDNLGKGASGAAVQNLDLMLAGPAGGASGD